MKVIAETMDRIICISLCKDSILGRKSGRDILEESSWVGTEFLSQVFCLISSRWQYFKLIEERTEHLLLFNTLENQIYELEFSKGTLEQWTSRFYFFCLNGEDPLHSQSNNQMVRSLPQAITEERLVYRWLICHIVVFFFYIMLHKTKKALISLIVISFFWTAFAAKLFDFVVNIWHISFCSPEVFVLP